MKYKGFKSFSKLARFTDLCSSVQYCSLCPRLSHRKKVLSDANGNVSSKVLFIAEAPGRLGADRTGIPLFGDRTGDIFQSFLGNIGWSREQIFITNAVLCNPRQDNGNNSPPTMKEIANCSTYLMMTIELIQPAIVVPLGKVALDALSLIHAHSIDLKTSVGKLFKWHDYYIFPLYHPGPRALIHRSLSKQRSDYMQLAKIVDPIKGFKKKARSSNDLLLFDEKAITPLQELILVFLSTLNRLSIFKLMKLIYLTDFLSLKELGRTLSGEIYLRQQEGPWIPSLKSTLEVLKENFINVNYKRKIPYVEIGSNYPIKTSFELEELDVIASVITKYGDLTEARIKTITYLTEPMKYILKQEKQGRKMYNMPVLYKNKTSSELDAERTTLNNNLP